MNAGMTRGEVAVMLARRYFEKEYVNEWQNISTSSFKVLKKPSNVHREGRNASLTLRGRYNPYKRRRQVRIKL